MKLKKLASFLPGFARKPGKPQPKPAPVITAAAPATKTPIIPTPAPDSEPPNPTKPQKMLEDVCAFLARYLQCSEHQRIVLALWVLHTWCFSAAKASPYLAIQSSQKLSGKSLCLRLLSVLCSNPALTSGYTPSVLVKRIHSHPGQLPTFLLDESPATVGSRSRSRNPRLRAILVSGFQPGIGYSDSSAECTIFSPKAFASTGPLPESLADCCLPIILKPLGPQPPSAASGGIERFDLPLAQQEAKPLVAALQHWSTKNIAALKSQRPLKRKDFPARLSPRGQDMVEPLFHLADAIGGDYSARARQALLAVFDDVEKQQRAIGLELLRDIRNIFQRYDWPDGLPTAVLVSELQSLPARPWDAEGRITDRTLPKMLRLFEIYPRMIRFKESGNNGSGKTLRGYSQKEFVTLWHNLLDQPQPSKQPQQETKATVPQETRVAPPPPAVSSLSSVATSSLASAATSEGTSKPTLAATPKSQIPNKDAACYTVTDVRIDRRIAGILDDPRNYFRQYPESHKEGTRDIIRNRYHWPQPADDKGPADVIYTLDDGITIPYTIVNRDPWDPKGIPSYHNKRERWPVLLSDEEKAQVATARFFELHAAASAQQARKKSVARDRGEVSAAVS